MAVTTRQSAKAQSHPQANLLGLPRELRDLIYGHVFDNLPLFKLEKRTPYYQQVGLVTASRQLYIETVDLCYKSTTIYMVHSDRKKGIDREEQRLFKWLRRLPRKRRDLIKEIWCDLPGVYCALQRPTCVCGSFADCRWTKRRSEYRRMQRVMGDQGIKLRPGVLKFRTRTCDYSNKKLVWSSFDERV
ncbi:hypothetical protein CLAFUW4_12042 [Fulvia fulva]|uniref:F-box domain-containing protein n=1 Tax=Passalora fulva TaxID=5499 RepID=A0A9Q8PE40_PASFU|nr:uncharacterized protein CLAFUR5_11081 [Fulvia fulva]KAK4617953.1 hypothetical protein CLAFUR4_12047 [Fulvia fulva]KAK4618735.1 hypothetical protein CLAFUR0_12058 [Fulvia fulva]UJO20764.1 hypothetical protein CLAFUR5_11081 [Fulvia fulva]WPV18459.1 hypothetical protein CLAFUW4_12042 [Fulvia fulva]WPV33546.1 hypothetical protein CLAFUW7_12049 [Fulvia fulva]